jgi:antitoxin YefM
MEAITYTEARNNLARTMDKVNDDHAPIIITRQNGQPVVMMALEDFEAWQETDYLLRSPANARRLLESVEQDRGGRTETQSLIHAE